MTTKSTEQVVLDAVIQAVKVMALDKHLVVTPETRPLDVIASYDSLSLFELEIEIELILGIHFYNAGDGLVFKPANYTANVACLTDNILKYLHRTKTTLPDRA